MSLASQTPPNPARSGFLKGFVLSLGAVALILAAAMGGALDDIARTAAEARPHAPDLDRLTGLSPVIQVHLYTALAALVLGGVLMAARKGRTFHRLAGWTWVALVSVTAGSTLFITSLNHGSWSFIHLFTGWTLLVLPLAVFWAKRREVARHRRAMMGLFYGGFAINLFIAFIPGRTMWSLFFA